MELLKEAAKPDSKQPSGTLIGKGVEDELKIN